MQAAVQQSNSPAVSEPLATTTEDTTDRSPETIKIEEEVVVADVSKSKSVSVDLRTEVVVEAERIELESPAEIPFQQQQQYDMILVNGDSLVHLYVCFFLVIAERKNPKSPSCTAILGHLKSNSIRGSLAALALK